MERLKKEGKSRFPQPTAKPGPLAQQRAVIRYLLQGRQEGPAEAMAGELEEDGNLGEEEPTGTQDLFCKLPPDLSSVVYLLVPFAHPHNGMVPSWGCWVGMK